MSNRREFLKDLASATAGFVFVSCGFAEAAARRMQAGGTGRRREVVVGGRRVKTVDMHSHCAIPEVWDLVKDQATQRNLQQLSTGPPGNPALLSFANVAQRFRQMDEWGIDVQAISLYPGAFYSWAEPDRARQIIKLQNEKIAEMCGRYPDRFVGLCAVALQHPDLAAEQLQDAVRNLGMRGCGIQGSVNGEELSSPRFHPFWAKAEALGCVVFIHPNGFPEGQRRFQGNGWLTNVIGNPLETTVALSHLIFEGTLDRFPGLKICAAHGGGFLPSYSGRSDRCFLPNPDLCKPVRKKPSEYLKQLYFDSMVFTGEGLRHLAAEVGASQIVLGTDFPFEWESGAVDHILNTPTLTDSEREAMLGGTAARLLKISA
ncbi:MAG: hypothetical protein A3H28_17015 [Acidobacteria bacterium RIFCSPLOWO2_02_FULL_61_28]|nr:MAG: hypothetical protein A3H28_17015 [Acidobacteria bacterium RIFCSPLOWO2_02_FULL_61_28]